MFNYKVYPNDRFTDQEADHYIQIEEGKFNGTCFNIGKIEFMGEDEEGNGKIAYDYSLFSLTEGLILEEEKADLEQVVGEILHDVIVKSLEDNTSENKDDNESGNFDINEIIA